MAERLQARGPVLRAAAACCLVAAALALAASASAAKRTFGSNLKTAPTRDTANGHRGGGVKAGPGRALLPDPHAGEDTSAWNPPAGGSTRAAGGQALLIKVRGCAIKDPGAPSTGGRQLSAGTPVNTIVFQTFHRQGSSYAATATTGRFLMPFCSNSSTPSRGRVSASTVTRFVPLHMCLARGDVVAFHDIGGFMAPQGGNGPWYPQGVPMDVIARVGGATMNSYVGVTSVYGPGSPGSATTGFAREPGEQLALQVLEGTGGDAYGLCPGGTAIEPSDSNRVICDNGPPTKGNHRCRNGHAVDAVGDAVARVAGMRLRLRLFE